MYRSFPSGAAHHGRPREVFLLIRGDCPRKNTLVGGAPCFDFTPGSKPGSDVPRSGPPCMGEKTAYLDGVVDTFSVLPGRCRTEWRRTSPVPVRSRLEGAFTPIFLVALAFHLIQRRRDRGGLAP